MKKRILSLLLILALAGSLFGCVIGPVENITTAPTQSSTQPTTQPTEATRPTQEDEKLDPSAFYYSKEEVALFIHQYGRLPENFVTKKQAKDQFGSYFKAMQADYRIGGDSFGNREGLLPAKDGRRYTECDIVAPGKTDRGAQRIVFSNDGLVYYTSDHYASFELLYGEP